LVLCPLWSLCALCGQTCNQYMVSISTLVNERTIVLSCPLDVLQFSSILTRSELLKTQQRQNPSQDNPTSDTSHKSQGTLTCLTDWLQFQEVPNPFSFTNSSGQLSELSQNAILTFLY
jgi:hypothetical protein